MDGLGMRGGQLRKINLHQSQLRNTFLESIYCTTEKLQLCKSRQKVIYTVLFTHLAKTKLGCFGNLEI
jgi:hypothetical protein